jgi:transcriptional regulator with XRE-family HTH domain
MIAISGIADYAANLRRLMAREGLTLAELVHRSGLNHRTLKDLLAGRHKPQPRTLHRLAASLNVPVEELFQDPALLRHRLFDRHTNPIVDEVIAAEPRLFHGWTPAEFDELYSRFGTGGALTSDGTLETVRAMNRRREMLAKVALLMETNEAEFLESMIELLYRRAVVVDLDDGGRNQSGRRAENRDLVGDASRATVGNAKFIG